MAPRPSSRRISYLPMVLISAIVRSPDDAMREPAAENVNAGCGPASRCSRRREISLVLVVDVPDGLLDQPLNHRVERNAALLRLRHAEHRCRLGADLHLFLGVAVRDLLRGFGVDDL